MLQDISLLTSLSSRKTSFSFPEYVISVVFLGAKAVFVLADGRAVTQDGTEIWLHPGSGILVAIAHQGALYTGGQDGRVVRTILRSEGEWYHEDLTPLPCHGWIDALAVSSKGAVAWSCGKRVFALDEKASLQTYNAPTSVRGLAFAPKGYRLAMAHHGGLSLWYPHHLTPAETYSFKSSFLDALFSPDGRFVFSPLQDHTLHGWRLQGRKEWHMRGYSAKIRSFSWASNKKILATSGASACILWPFDGAEGPMGRAPLERGVRPCLVTFVACHPQEAYVAIGYQDGWVLLSRLQDGAEWLIHQEAEGKSGPVTSLCWHEDGKRLAYGTQQGSGGILNL